MNISEQDLQVIEIIENDDGSADIVIDISDDFKEEFKKFKGLKRFSKKAFEKFVIESLETGLEICQRAEKEK